MSWPFKCGPRNRHSDKEATLSPIGIERVDYIALKARDPESASAFVTERLGFNLVHAHADGTYHLSERGVDRCSLVYKRLGFNEVFAVTDN